MGQFIGTPLFWGVILILFGAAVVLKAVFRIDIPLGRILIAILLISWGIVLLSGRRFWHGGRWDDGKDSAVFFSGEVVDEGPLKEEYSVFFGSRRIDLREVDLSEGPKIRVNAVFGSIRVTIPDDIPVEVRSETAFGTTRLPDGETAAFGDSAYRNRKAREGSVPITRLETSVVFGSMDVRER
jgi:predicted membrane protein